MNEFKIKGSIAFKINGDKEFNTALLQINGEQKYFYAKGRIALMRKISDYILRSACVASE